MPEKGHTLEAQREQYWATKAERAAAKAERGPRQGAPTQGPVAHKKISARFERRYWGARGNVGKRSPFNQTKRHAKLSSDTAG